MIDWLKHIKNSPVGKLNRHLFDDKQPSARKVRKDSHHVIWLKNTLTEWCSTKDMVLLSEHQFNPLRKYSFDFAIEEVMVAIEFEGGIWMKGGGAHSRPANIERDIEKYNLAQSMGWKVIRLHAKNYKTVISELKKYKE